MNGLAAPVIEFRALAPLLLLFAAACLGILVEAVVDKAHRYLAQVVLLVTSVVVAFAFLVANWRKGVGGPLVAGSLMLDGPTYFIWGSILVFGLLSVLLFAERRLGGGSSVFAASAATVPGSPAEAETSAAKLEHTEVFPLALFAMVGMMVFPASGDLITMFVALEVFSLPLYLMCGMARRRRLLSQEAALKYFLLGALASAFFLFGIALVYAFSGTFDLAGIATAVGAPPLGRGLLFTGMVLIAVGLLFKVGAVPFHSWTPDVYTGAPTPVTGFMAVCTKIAALGAVLRVFYVAFGPEVWSWQPLMAVVAVLTMVVGVVVGLVQTDVKRMLAYSSIAHAGFILTGLVGATMGSPGAQLSSVGAIMFYLVAYGFATVGAFAIVTLVRNNTGEVNSLDGWAGLGRKHPLLGGIFAFFMLSFAGIPLTGGFIGKWAVFASAWRGGYAWLVVVAIVMSLTAASFYIRVVLIMFFGDPASGVQIGRASGFTWTAIGAGALAVLVLGVAPGQLLDLASLAGTFLR